MSSPILTHHAAKHGIVIDDFFLFSLSRAVADQCVERVLAAYRRSGFVVKQSKVVMPTSSPVKVIGFDIDGARGVIQLPPDSACSLVAATMAVLRCPTVTGSTLSRIVGRWTWVMMLRRPTLAILQHCYRYIGVAQHRRFTLWRSVRRELCSLLAVLPLLNFQLDSAFLHDAIASDASEMAGGVVTAPLTPQLLGQLWLLSADRRHAVAQAKHNACLNRANGSEVAIARHMVQLEISPLEASRFSAFY
jgi:hypothetical protein